MRVTDRMMSMNLSQHLHNSMRRMDKFYDQLSTGKKFSRPSEDPMGALFSMRARNDIEINDQFRRNVESAEDWLNNTDNLLDNLGKIAHRASELMVQAANETYEQTSFDSIAKEVEELREGLLELANTRFGDRYIFSGQRTQSPAYERVIDTGTGEVSFNYLGDDGGITFRLAPGAEVSINLNGEEVFQPFFDILGNFMENLSNGDSQAISQDDKAAINQQMDNFLAQRAEVGALGRRMELSKERLLDQEVHLRKSLADAESVDIPKVIAELNMEENVYRSALAAGARIVQPSLIDFLR